MKKLSAFLMFFFCFTAILFAQDIFTLAMSGTPEEIQAAIDAGTKLDDRDNKGRTPLIWAAEFNHHPEVITTLVNAGADPTITSKAGKTALDYAQDNAKIKGTSAFEALRSATVKAK